MAGMSGVGEHYRRAGVLCGLLASLISCYDKPKFDALSVCHTTLKSLTAIQKRGTVYKLYERNHVDKCRDNGKFFNQHPH